MGGQAELSSLPISELIAQKQDEGFACIRLPHRLDDVCLWTGKHQRARRHQRRDARRHRAGHLVLDPGRLRRGREPHPPQLQVRAPPRLDSRIIAKKGLTLSTPDFLAFVWLFV